MRRRAGFTLIEMLIVIAIIAILAAILMPVFAKAKGKAVQVSCASNVRQVVQGLVMYSIDHDGLLPASWGRGQALGLERKVFGCSAQNVTDYDDPNGVSCPGRGVGTITVNSNFLPDVGNAKYWNLVADVKAPAATALAWCGNGRPSNSFFWYNNGEQCHGVSQRHNNGTNFGFADGHVKWVDTSILPYLGRNDAWMAFGYWPPYSVARRSDPPVAGAVVAEFACTRNFIPDEW